MLSMEIARETVLNRRRGPGEKWDEKRFKQVAEEVRERNHAGIANGCWWPLKYLYREVSDAELKEFLAFFDTPAGRWYLAAHHNASRQAWTSAGQRLGREGWEYYALTERAPPSRKP